MRIYANLFYYTTMVLGSVLAALASIAAWDIGEAWDFERAVAGDFGEIPEEMARAIEEERNPLITSEETEMN